MKTLWILLIFKVFLFSGFSLMSQEYSEGREHAAFTIPSAPAFAILGVNPEIVQRPSDIKNFKVDWRIKNYNLAPDLALEGQPLWYFIYRKKPIRQLYQSSMLAKKLSTLSVSLATAKIDGINHAAYALKLNLYKEKDPLTSTSDHMMIEAEFQQAFQLINVQLDELQMQLRIQDINRDSIQESIDQLKAQALLLVDQRDQQMISLFEDDPFQRWNRSMVDIAFGRVFTYDNGRLDSLKIQSAGYALWVNGAIGIGTSSLVTGLLRWSRVHFNNNYLVGLSYRFGNDKFNFFAELVLESLGNYYNVNSDDPFAENEVFSEKFESDIGNGWIGFNPGLSSRQYTISYGGDFKLSKNILLNFAIRTQFAGSWSLNRLIPVANVVCLMN
jgi:hypothetical protein